MMWITRVLRPQGRIGLHTKADAFFNRGMSNAISFPQIPPVPLPSKSSSNVRRDIRLSRSAGVHADVNPHSAQPVPQTVSKRKTVSPQRFYTPPGAMNGQTAAQWANTAGMGGFAPSSPTSRQVQSELADAGQTSAPDNVIAVDGAAAGIGASTLAALLSRELTERGCKCVLVDADLAGGGLDVLLGMENEDGTRFGDVSAPLGNIDGKALLRELPVWDGVPLLACDPWKNENPQSWEVQACVRALAQARDAVVVDVGQWHGLRDAPDLAQAIRITVVELTVLGLARAKAAMRSHDAPQNRGSHFIVGIEPRGVVRSHGATTPDEAESYLGRGVEAAMKPDAKLCSELLDGLGLRKPNRQTARSLSALADRVQEALDGKRDEYGTRTS